MNYNMYNSFEMDEIDVVVVYVCRVVCMVSIYDRMDGPAGREIQLIKIRGKQKREKGKKLKLL